MQVFNPARSIVYKAFGQQVARNARPVFGVRPIQGSRTLSLMSQNQDDNQDENKEDPLPFSAWKGRSRFYEKVEVAEHEADGTFRVLLDGNMMTTPRKNALEIPTRNLAMALAFEWDRQGKTIETLSMPLMTLMCSTIDVTRFKHEVLVEELMRFFITDTLCYHTDEDAPLGDAETHKFMMEAQDKYWEPIINWVTGKFGPIDIVKGAIATPMHPQDTYDAVKQHLMDMDDWELTATESLAYGCKSLMVPLAVMEGLVTPEDAFHASRLEEESQLSAWGLVEGGHDIDRANTLTQISAAAAFTEMLRNKNL